MRYYLGVDGGGSKCYAVLMDETGTVLGWGRSGPTTYQADEAAAQHFQRAMDAAVAEVCPPEVRVAGIWMDAAALDGLRKRGIPLTYAFVGEQPPCLAAALKPHGVVVHAGTGCFVFTRTRAGQDTIVGGMGPILGDEGAGWDIGIRGVRAGLRHHWSREVRTVLAETLPPLLGVSSLREMPGRPIYTGQFSRARIAALAPAVIAAAEAGDGPALGVLRRSAESLAELVRLSLCELGLLGQGYPLVGIGGVIQGSPFYWRLLRERILVHDPTLVPEVPPVRMCVGAAFELMRRDGATLTPELRNRVLQTQKRFPGADVITRDGG